MKRALFTLVFSFLAIGTLRADDEVTVRSREKPIIGVIKSETPSGIVLEKGSAKENIGTEDILDIHYDLPSTPEMKFGAYSGARKEEKDSLDPTKDAKRKAHLQAALAKYKEVFDKTKDKLPRRHMQYKMAMIQLRLAQETGDPIDPAIKALVEFKDSFPSSWQVVPVLQTLAQFHAGRGEFKQAADAFKELAGLPLSADAKVDAQIQAARINLRAKNHDEALKQLQGVMAAHEKDKKGRYYLRAMVAANEVLIAQGKGDDAMKTLRAILKETTDKGIKAAAYNALGEGYMKNDQFKEARWEFLWVDVVYNQEPAEHARALYNLARAFEALGDADRALQCRETLATERQFAGLEYQRLAQGELGDKGK